MSPSSDMIRSTQLLKSSRSSKTTPDAVAMRGYPSGVGMHVRIGAFPVIEGNTVGRHRSLVLAFLFCYQRYRLKSAFAMAVAHSRDIGESTAPFRAFTMVTRSLFSKNKYTGMVSR